MKALTTLMTLETLEELSSRSNFRYGKEIAKNGKVKTIKVNTFNVTAEVTKGSSDSRVAELMSTVKGLRWKCSCTARKDYFCEHCVALGLFLAERNKLENAA